LKNQAETAEARKFGSSAARQQRKTKTKDQSFSELLSCRVA